MTATAPTADTRWARVAAGSAFYLLTLVLAVFGDVGGAWVLVVLIAFVSGFIARSGWFLLALPVLSLVVLWLNGATDCPDCGGGGEEQATSVKAVWFAFGSALLGVVATLGHIPAALMNAMLRPRGMGPWPYYAAAGLMFAGIVAVSVGRYSSNRDANGPVVYELGDKRIRTGQEWDPEGSEHSVSLQQIMEYQSLPLYWLGPSFERLNLTTARLGGGDAAGADALFIYGDCGPAPCQAPVQVMIRSGCQPRPDIASAPSETLADGALLKRYSEGHIMVWTGTVSITVYGPNRVYLDTALVGLRRPGLDPMPLGPPNFDVC